jgi:cytochrome c oxidase assembly factor CtaG
MRALSRLALPALAAVLCLAAAWPRERGAGGWGLSALCAAARESAPTWTFSAWIVDPLLLSAALYASGVADLWRRAGIGRGVALWRVGLYGAAWLSLAAALVSPLHWLGDRLFAAHMIEHEIVMAVAAPLFVLAAPGGAMLRPLPRRLRRWLNLPRLRSLWAWLTRPMIATISHGVAIWLWHAPALFDAALENAALHRLQHVSFFVTALFFWQAMLRRSDRGVACFHVFATMVHTSLLGALIALAPHVLYRAQTAQSAAWGFTPLEDQQLAGLIMWAPAGALYAGAALALAALWIKRSSEQTWTTRDALEKA